MTGSYLVKLRGGLGNIIAKAAGGTLEEKYTGRIPEAHIHRLDDTGGLVAAPLEGTFKAQQSYLQVIVNQMFVSQDRELWVEREHLGAVWMGFRYGGAMQSIPFMVGRDLLVDRVSNLPRGARIEFQDVRIGKMYPYSGDGLALYLGLWSTPTVDWATGVFSALDTIAGKVKVAASLSQVLELVDVLNEGVSTVLGLKAIQAHLNLYQEFQDPGAGEVGVLQPGYFVMIDVPRTALDASTLRVIDGRLHIQREQPEAVPYYEHDFLLYSIVCHSQHPTALDMFGKQYDATLAALIGSKSDPNKLALAAQEYHALQTQIVTSPDLTRGDKNRLILEFSQSLNADAISLAVNLKAPNVSFAVGQPPRIPAGLRKPTQADHQAFSAHVDGEQLLQNPATTAGAAARQFSAALEAASPRR